MTARKPDRPIYTIKFRPERGVADPVRTLRWLLKVALRRFGMRAIDIRQNEPEPAP